MTTTEERVVLLAEDGSAVGAATKRDVHHFDTPLHLAFSCYVVDDRGHLLITRRALGKKAWPGTWTNAFCGHPAPFEPVPEAVVRRGRDELGLEVDGLDLVLPDFRYRAVDASGIVENEICPVYVARAAGPIAANPDEVMDVAWAAPADLRRAVEAAPWAFSPWMVTQITEMSADPGATGIDWSVAS